MKFSRLGLSNRIAEFYVFSFHLQNSAAFEGFRSGSGRTGKSTVLFDAKTLTSFCVVRLKNVMLAFLCQRRIFTSLHCAVFFEHQ